MNSMYWGKLKSVLVAVVGGLLAIKGVGDMDWNQLLTAFTGEGGPMVVAGFALIIVRAWGGEKQMELPEAFRTKVVKKTTGR